MFFGAFLAIPEAVGSLQCPILPAIKTVFVATHEVEVMTLVAHGTEGEHGAGGGVGGSLGGGLRPDFVGEGGGFDGPGWI